ncbi:MAG: WbqC family protein [Polyangiaceae bacterium]
MIVSVHQPQYLPWLGYFDKIDKADAFVLLDDVQYKKNEWQNRNRIKTAQGWQWLTVPVNYRFPQTLNQVSVNRRDRWQARHRQSIISNYRRAPHWTKLESFFEELFSTDWANLAALNIWVVRRLAKVLGITTPISVSSELATFPSDPDERLIAITKHMGGDTYLAGAGGQAYMQIETYARSGVRLEIQSYPPPKYNQLFGAFQPFMSVIDLVFNHGDESLSILRGNR